MMNLITPTLNKKSQAISGESQLRHFGQFLLDHDRMLQSLNENDDRENFYRNSGKPEATKCAPVALKIERDEHLSLFQLANSKNTILNKTVCVFAQLCTEVRELQKQSEELQLHFLFLDWKLCGSDGEDLAQPKVITRTSEMLRFFCDIQYLVQRCMIVGSDVLRQLGAFFGGELGNSGHNGAQLQSVFGRLADLAVILVTFDQIIVNSNARECWPILLKSIDSVQENLDRFPGEFTTINTSGLQNVFSELSILFTGDLFQMLLDGLQSLRMTFDINTLTSVMHYFDAYLRTQFFKIEKYTHVILNDFTEARDVIKVNVMCVLHHSVFGKLDPALFGRLFEVNSRHCGITLVEHFLWQPEVFIGRYVVLSPKSAAAKAQTKYIGDAVRLRHEFWKNRFPEAKIQEMTQALCGRACVWMINIRREAKFNGAFEVNANSLTQRGNLIMDGNRLMGEILFFVKLITNLHIQLSTPMSRPTLANVCRLLHNYKAIKNTYEHHSAFYIESMRVVGQHLSYHTLCVIQLTIRRKFANHLTVSAASSYNEQEIDILCALQLAEKCMFGPITATRVQVTRLALSISDPTSVFSTEHLDILCDRMTKMEMLIELDTTLRKCPDTTFVYWHQPILTSYIKHVLGPNVTFQAPAQSVDFLSGINACGSDSDFNSNINHLLRTTVLAQVCSLIENNLRLFIHSYMHDETKVQSSTAADHKKEAIVSNETAALINMNPIPLVDHYFTFKNHIEHYLSKTFYNLTAVSLSDGRTYSEIRSFSRIKYGLELVEDQLPTETLEQGLDLLDIMRFMNEFSTKFVYDMNSQVFFQATSGNDFLNTVTVSHIMNSLRTHGIGIMNTAINCGYKLLCQKMPLVSKFLYTDKMKSALSKCVNHFKENKERLSERFSFDLAKTLVKNVPRLTTNDLSFEHFLATITHIGNIMGFVRLVRSAGIKYVSKAGVFLPPKMIVDKFDINDKYTELQLSDVTCEAAWNVKVNAANLSKDFVTKPDYFKSFLQAFNDVIRDPKNKHLQHFYIIVPALTIQFVDDLIRSKEYKHKSTDSDRLVFTDDGFAMGLAYILIVLDQVDAFMTLDWFAAVRIKYEAELVDLEAKRSTLNSSFEDEKLKQTLMLTAKRIHTLSEEFEMLRCNLRCALRFFHL